MYRLLLVAASVAFANGASLSIIEPRIIGGSDTTIASVPFQVSVQEMGRGHYCGGIILSSTKILTAGRCGRSNKDPKMYKIRAGSNKYDEGGQLLEVLKMEEHSKFNPQDLIYNAAIITLKQPIKLGAHAQAVTFAPNEPAVGDNVTVTGWGVTDQFDPKFSQVLQTIQVPVIDKTTCTAKLEKHMKSKIPSDTFCAGGDGQNIYPGDHGGPAINSKNQLVGISVYSHPYFTYYPGLYTNVNNPAIREFIKTHM